MVSKICWVVSTLSLFVSAIIRTSYSINEGMILRGNCGRAFANCRTEVTIETKLETVVTLSIRQTSAGAFLLDLENSNISVVKHNLPTRDLEQLSVCIDKMESTLPLM
jgi:hypothetical protein